MPPRTQTLPELTEHLRSRVSVTESGCWLWLGARNRTGYAYVHYKGASTQLGHRLMYLGAVGPIPDDLPLDHTCHNADPQCPGGPQCAHRACINPDHLEPVTSGENTRRSPRATKSICAHGHELTPENTYRLRGKRFCRACNRAARRRRKERQS